MTRGCLWLDGLIPELDVTRPLPANADVAIIGGGYTGVAAARALALHGAQSVVLERETLGWGASTRNGGFVLPGFKQDPGVLVKRLGRATARLLFEESMQSIGFLEDLIATQAVACDYRRSGHVTLAENPRQLRALARSQRLLQAALGYDTRLLGTEEVRCEVGSARFCGGLLDAGAGSLHPARLFHGLMRSAESAGATLLPHTEALRIQRDGAAFLVETTRGTIRARDVFIATDGYSGPVHRKFRRRVVPIGSYIIATAPLGQADLQHIIPRRRVLSDSRNLLHYFRISDDRLVFGGRASFTPTSTAHSAAILRRDMVEVFPELAETAVEFAWSGNVGFTRDQMPHAGRLDDVAFAGGYCGHGVAMAIYLGDRMGQYLAGRADLPALGALDFPAIPLYNGQPWFLPAVGMWYRLLDWAVRR